MGLTALNCFMSMLRERKGNRGHSQSQGKLCPSASLLVFNYVLLLQFDFHIRSLSNALHVMAQNWTDLCVPATYRYIYVLQMGKNSSSLESLILKQCEDIICLEIPCQLLRLRWLKVFDCLSLQLIEIKAPNISIFDFTGDETQLSLGESLQLKNLTLNRRCAINYAIDTLASSVQNLEALTLRSSREVPVQSKYDFIAGDPSTLRQMLGRHHNKLKTVIIIGFCRQKSLVELTRHILQSATSLKSLTLITIDPKYQFYGHTSISKCPTLDKEYIRDVWESIWAIKTYIEGGVPSTVKFKVYEPCRQCHSL
nr:uncharacterized protein LOC127304209 [Lolium perenne]